MTTDQTSILYGLIYISAGSLLLVARKYVAKTVIETQEKYLLRGKPLSKFQAKTTYVYTIGLGLILLGVGIYALIRNTITSG